MNNDHSFAIKHESFMLHSKTGAPGGNFIRKVYIANKYSTKALKLPLFNHQFCEQRCADNGVKKTAKQWDVALQYNLTLNGKQNIHFQVKTEILFSNWISDWTGEKILHFD